MLEVGLAEDDVADALDRLLLIMGVAYVVTLAVAILGGAFLAGRALSPVDKITRLARRISADDLGQRLDLQLADDEVGRLASTFDEMIARLDSSFRRQRQFTADASHELRTPLTIMKGQIDVALQKERQPQDYRQVLEAVNDEVDRLIRLAGSLLTLTRADLSSFLVEYDAPDDGLDVVVFAAPQLSLFELRELAGLLDGRRVHPEVGLIVATSPENACAAVRLGLAGTIEDSGAILLEGVCFYQMHARELGLANGWTRLMTNSAKLANIIGGYGYEPVLADMGRCVEAAVAGRIVR